MVTHFPLLDTLKGGTSSLRFTMARVALSSKMPSADHSMRMSREVSTVKRAGPTVTTASGLATGLSWAAAKLTKGRESKSSRKIERNFNMTLTVS